MRNMNPVSANQGSTVLSKPLLKSEIFETLAYVGYETLVMNLKLLESVVNKCCRD